MATKQIGKLKLHWSKRGLAFKWGDGDIHRISFEGKKREDTYQADRQGPMDFYDERYEGYDGGGYYGEQPYEGSKNAFLYSSDVLMYLLLLILPPLGIWVMWKKEKFSSLVRAIVTAVAGIWFIVLLIWLFTALLGGGKDPTHTGAVTPVTPVTPVATQVPAAQEQPAQVPQQADAESDVTVPAAPAIGAADADATVPGASGVRTTTAGTTSTSAADYCYAVGTSQYFHADQSCPNIEENATRTTVALARSRGQIQCPVCYKTDDLSGTAGSTGTMTTDSTTLYATKKGKYYHVDPNCGGMTGASVITLAQAKKEGKKVCPKCIGIYYATPGGKYYHTTPTCSGMSNAKNTTAAAAEAAGKKKCPVCLEKAQKSVSTTGTYYSTRTGRYYHSKPNCSGMKGATKVTAAIIKKRGQKPCPVCIGATAPVGSGKYYATRTGKYYHTKSTCSGMKGASAISLATAKKYGKKPCPKCVPKASSTAPVGTGAYYATATSKYYHKDKTCGNMKNPRKVTRATAEKYGKKPCPICLKDLATYVYGTSGGKYYHKTAACPAVKNAKRMTLAAAKAKGKTACPTCFKSQAAKEKIYYATATNRYYHSKPDCSGMMNATKVSLATAKAKGKTACPVCIKKQKKEKVTYYYAVADNKYYHTKSNCSGMTGAVKITAETAKKYGKTACPVCVKKKKTDATPTPTPPGVVYCYASTGSRYYHRVKNCSGLKNLKKVTLTAAKNRGKTACPVCVTKKVDPKRLTTAYADKLTICYASAASAFYHTDKSCVLGLKKTTVLAAKNRGKLPCPSCSKNTNVYVYVNRSETRYHRKANCSGVRNRFKVSLHTALKQNYVRCPKCNAPKKK
jgi:hypothetical protein